MQQYLDIPHPCGGGVFAKGVFDSGASLSAKDFVRVGVECEIAVRLARDLALTEEPFTAEWVAESIEAYLPAIEIVDDRYGRLANPGRADLGGGRFLRRRPACSANPSRASACLMCFMWSAARSSTA